MSEGRLLGTGRDLALVVSNDTGRLLAVTPTECAPLSLPSSVEAMRGGRIDLPIGGTGESQRVVHLTLEAPDGREVLWFGHDLVLPSDAPRVAFTPALNDPPGRWTLRLLDPACGATASSRIWVR